MNARQIRAHARVGWLILCAGAPVLGACISGRVLEGYPGYPFLSFTAPAVPDSTFFRLQRALETEGFELDYTERADGTINTRPSERASGPLLLTVVVDSASSGSSSRVWVAGYRPVRDGARRIDPLRREAWAELRDITGRLSARVGGSHPEEPDPPDG